MTYVVIFIRAREEIYLRQENFGDEYFDIFSFPFKDLIDLISIIR